MPIIVLMFSFPHANRLLGKCQNPSIHLETIDLEPDLANYGPWSISEPQSVFINEVLSELSQTQSFMYCLWLLFHYNYRVE